MIHFTRKNDAKKVELLMRHEGEDNKKNRENILAYFGVNHITNLQRVIEVYKKEYHKENIDKIADIEELIMNHVPVLQLLFEQGYDSNMKYYDGKSVLFYAAVYNIDALKFLLAYPKIDLNAKNDEGFTVFLSAIAENNIEALRSLFIGNRVYPNMDIDDITTFHDVVRKNNIGLKHVPVDLRIDPNIDCTDFYSAAVQKNTDVLKLLLTHPKVDLNVKDRYGIAAIHYAVKKDNSDGLGRLLAINDVDCNVQDRYGLTALHYAAERNNIEAINLLINSKVNLNIKDNNGATALHCAVKKNNIEATNLLVNSGIDLNIKDDNGYTAFHYAAERNNIEALKVMITHPLIDLNSKNKDGLTVYELVTTVEMIQILPEYISFFSKHKIKLFALGVGGGGVIGLLCGAHIAHGLMLQHEIMALSIDVLTGKYLSV